LDSSSIACVARKLLAQSGDCRLPTFSAIYDKVRQCDERPFIRAVLTQDGFEPHYVHGDQIGPLTDLDRVFWHEDEAFYGPSLFLHWGLFDAASRQGMRVLLDGFDGDGTVSHGFLYLDELARAGRWVRVAIEARGLARCFHVSPWKLLKDYAWFYGFQPLISKHSSLKMTRRAWRALYRRVPGRRNPSASLPVRLAILNADFVQRAGIMDRHRAWLRARPDAAQTEREAHYRRLTQGIQPLALESLDKAAAAFGLEARYPFWDKRLVEFCLSVPPEQKLCRGWSRVIMRRAMSDILPAEVQWRDNKTDFMPVFMHGLLNIERERLDKTILYDSRHTEQYVNHAVLREIYHRFVSQKSEKEVIPM
jgi:asparagine synthase (glutamine-hydrolysing)